MIFRGDSLSSSHIFTHSVTQSLSHSGRFYQIRRKIQSFQWNTIPTTSYHHKPFYTIPYHSTPYQPIPPHTIPYHHMQPHTIPYHLYVSHLFTNCIITSHTDSYHPMSQYTIIITSHTNITIYHYHYIPYNLYQEYHKSLTNLLPRHSIRLYHILTHITLLYLILSTYSRPTQSIWSFP